MGVVTMMLPWDLRYDLRRRDRQQRRLDAIHIDLRIRQRGRKHLRIGWRRGGRVAEIVAQHGDKGTGSDTGRIAPSGESGAA